MGAAGGAMGTRFIATQENSWHPNYKRRIVQASEWSDVILPGVYGSLRALDNKAVGELDELIGSGHLDEDELTEKDRRMVAAQKEGDVEGGLLPAGQCAAPVDDIASVAELVPALFEEAVALLRRALDGSPSSLREASL